MEPISGTNAPAAWDDKDKAKELMDVKYMYVMDELTYYASLHPLGSSVRLSAADNMWFSGTLFGADTTNKVKNYLVIHESAPDRQKTGVQVIGLAYAFFTDPSRYSMIYGSPRLRCQPGTSPQIFLDLEDAGKFSGSLDKQHNALDTTKHDESGYYFLTDGQHCRYSSNECS